MRSGHAVPPPAGSDVPQNMWTWQARKISGTGLRAAAVLLVLTTVTLALLQYGGAYTFLTDAGIVAPSIPEWQHTHDVVSALMPGYAFAQAIQTMLSLTPADSVTDGSDYPELDGANGIATFQTGGHIYAAVVSFNDDGVQILNVTDPDNISAAGHVADGSDYPELDGANGIATFQTGGHIYAAVVSFTDDGVQILNVTDPDNISAAGHVADGSDYPELDGAIGISTFQTGGDIYAAVVSFNDDGVQILNVTDPDNISAAGHAADGSDYPELDGARGIAIFEAGGDTYAAVASSVDDGVQILNVTDPYNISAAGHAADGSDYPELDGATGIAIFQTGGDTYAAVASAVDDSVQILDVTDPYNITAAGNATDGSDYPELDGANGITTFQTGGHTYAAVASFNDDGVQILDVTDPDNIAAAGNATDGSDYPELDGAIGISTFQTGGHTYAAVASFEDDGVQIIRLTDVEDTTSFITTWQTTGANQTVTIPGTGTYTVDWGDGTTDTDVTGTPTHTYAAADTYTVSISGGLDHIRLANDPANAVKLRSIEQWGNIEWNSMDASFQSATNMVYNADDTPDLSKVTRMANMFRDATAFNGDISGWDTSSVTSMASVFRGATSFNGSISDWDVSNVNFMTSMFNGATAFNGNISSWDVSSVTHMPDMFRDAIAFNGNISSWDVSSVTHMPGMFHGATIFNSDISGWNVSKVDDMVGMFRHATSFNGNISGWDVSKVADMSNMFNRASVFNGNISGWDVSKVTDMSTMFDSAFAFKQDISGWNVSSVTHMNGMFSYATTFNGNISGWDVSNVNLMNGMFQGTDSFNSDISGWDVSKVTDMYRMFYETSSFNRDISGWDVSSATRMAQMFLRADAFDQNLGKWYIVPADTSYGIAEASLNVTTISAQNFILNNHAPNYNIGTGGNSTLFNMTGGTLMFKVTPSSGDYTVSVTAPGGDFGTDNHRILDIEVMGQTPDTTPPVITRTGSSSVTITVGDSYTDQGATCVDNVDGSITPTSSGTVDTNTAGTYTITYSCTDTAGNNATPVTRTVIVQQGADTTPPVITRTGSSSVTITVGDSYTDQGATCVDNVDGSITPTSSGTVDTNTAGTYTITYSCTDTAGNNATPVTRTVIVQQGADTTPPAIIIHGSNPARVLVGTVYVDAGATCRDNFDGDFEPTSTTNTVDADNVGSYTVTYTCIDAESNESERARTVRVLEEGDFTISKSSKSAPLTVGSDIMIDGKNHDIGGSGAVAIKQNEVVTGEPVEITFTAHSADDIIHLTVYLNLHGGDTRYAYSDTYIRYDHGTVQIHDPHSFISDASITITDDTEQPDKKIIDVIIEFDGDMGLTNMVLYMWNEDRNSQLIRIIDAIEVVTAPQEPEVQAADLEPVEPDSVLPVDPEPMPADTVWPGDYDEAQVLSLIRMWSGFESETITDEQLLASLGLDDDDYPDADIPDWVMTDLGVLVAKGDVTVGEFMLALQYVLEYT